MLTAAALLVAVDLAATLVGTWQGRIPMPPIRESSRNVGVRTNTFERGASYEDRALTITSVTKVDGKWTATGRFGRVSGGGVPVTIDVVTDGDTVSLRFPYGEDAVITVELVGNALEGRMSGKHPRPIRLEKTHPLS